MDYTLGAANIAMEGDVVRAQEHIPRAKQVLRNLLVRMKAGGLEVGMDHWAISEDAYCYAIVAGSVKKAIIVVGDVRASDDGLIEHGIIPQIPDFVSGVVVGGTIKKGGPNASATLNTFWPTLETGRLHGLSGQAPIAKLAVEPYTDFKDALSYQGPAGLVFSQYVLLKPTMYSGLMRKVVQFVMGFGKQSAASIYDKSKPVIEERRTDKRPPTKYESDVASVGRQIRFDWRWFRTHGITKAQDGRLWLVEIGSTRGIVARPLPEHPLTRTPEFRQKLERLGDQAGATALDEFGAWPTGEAFPPGGIEAWKRAGLVVELMPKADMSPFYQNSPFSSVLGWAFNETGSEAHNTCNGWDDDLQFSAHFMCGLSIGSIIPSEGPASGSSSLKNRFLSLQKKQAYIARFDAVMAKIDRLEQREVDSFLHAHGSIEDQFEDIDAVVLAPIATGSAHLSLVSKSPIYDPSRYQSMIKFPHPELGFLVSHDMRSSGPVGDPRCDATMHVFFSGNELKYVRYFRDPRARPELIDTNDFEDCMYVGEWRAHQETGIKSMFPMMYSNDFDHREEIADSTRDTLIRGKDLGYWDVYVVDDLAYPVKATLHRRKRFQRYMHVKIVDGAFSASAVTVPFYDRCAYYYTVAKGTASRQEFSSYSLLSLEDPWYCETWRNVYGFTHNATHPDNCCVCTARTVLSPAPRYSPYDPCQDFADSGPWCFTCDNADSMTYAIPQPPQPSEPPINVASEVNRKTYIVNATEFSPLQIEDVQKNKLDYGNPWFIPSPNPDGGAFQYIEVTHNAMGDGDAMRYMKEPNAGPYVRIGGPFPPEESNSGITFIGVVP